MNGSENEWKFPLLFPLPRAGSITRENPIREQEIMTIYRIPTSREEDLKKAIELTGADERCFQFFNRKRELLSFFIPRVDFRAANALKQELLSRGGDAIVHKRAIEGAVDVSNVVIMGNMKTLRDLVLKLRVMPYWGLDRIRTDIETALDSQAVSRWQLRIPGKGIMELGGRTRIMGIINVNRESFFPGSRADDPRSCVETAAGMIEEGAAIIDIGAESTRPGSSPLSREEEIDRLVPAISAVRKALPEAVISADTYRAGTALAAIESGADIINDISGGSFDPEMFPLLAGTGNPVVIMHARNVPEGMHRPADYTDIIGEIASFFFERIMMAEEAGMNRDQIILDPGIGFSKNAQQSLETLRNAGSFSTLARPLLVGHSRKSVIGRHLCLENPEERLEGTLAISAFCAWNNIAVIRVHDVKPNIRAVRMIEAMKGEGI